MKKILLIIFLLMGILSCSQDKKNIYEKYLDKFYQYHPEGYGLENEWYYFTSESFVVYEDGRKEIFSVKFVGIIDFESASFSGTTNEFVLESEKIEVSKDYEIVKTKTYDSLKNKKWYSYEKKETNNEVNEIVTGRDDIVELSVSFLFDEDIFYPENLTNKKEECHVSISKELDYLSFSSAAKAEEYEENVIIEYLFYDNLDKNPDEFDLKKVKRTISKSYENIKLVSNDATLEKTEPIHVEEKEYDISSPKNGPEVLKEKL